jgi:hypothetical protein
VVVVGFAGDRFDEIASSSRRWRSCLICSEKLVGALGDRVAVDLLSLEVAEVPVDDGLLRGKLLVNRG